LETAENFQILRAVLTYDHDERNTINNLQEQHKHEREEPLRSEILVNVFNNLYNLIYNVDYSQYQYTNTLRKVEEDMTC
jgi:hypothetical protein